ncbi:hypothetical protein ACH4OX_36265 [Streptomyces roseolus]|uniref:hypothetical protein n=1 Tax=Streptomyces roseolus TaxID=67358 RepID=UPI0037B551B9
MCDDTNSNNAWAELWRQSGRTVRFSLLKPKRTLALAFLMVVGFLGFSFILPQLSSYALIQHMVFFI